MGGGGEGRRAWDDGRAAEVYPGLPDPIRRAIGEAVGAGAGAAHAADLPQVLNVRPDPRDFRDLHYEPGLARLPDAMVPPALPPGRVRVQGGLGSCTGQALAAVVDILHARAAGWPGPPAPQRPVSARMLYEMARAHDELRTDGLDGSSLRGVLKGLFHNGVCEDRLAPYDAGEQDWELSVEMAIDARRIGLGSYLRLRHIADHWHAALNETGAVLASAVLHEGWDGRAVARAGGRIVVPNDARPLGAHAFAVVGFTPEGFLVLNSQGPGWGGFRPDARDGQEPERLPGVALWGYADWARHVLDGWVLRLSARAPEAFRLIGGYTGASVRPPRSTTPRIEINGHYVNLDRGYLVNQGAYPSATPGLQRTRDWLAGDGAPRHPRLLLHFEDALDGRFDMAARAAWLVPRLKARDIYPVVVFWAEGFAEAATSLLQGMAPAVHQRAGGPGAVADMMLEAEARRFLRPLWRDMRAQAVALADRKRHALPALKMLLGLMEARAEGGRPLELHLSAYGAGALALCALSRPIARSGVRVGSMHLLSPLCRVAEVARLRRTLRPAASAVLNLRPEDAQAERCGPYGGPLAQLLERSLEPEDGAEAEPMAALSWPSGRGAPAWAPGRDGSFPRTHRDFGDDPRVWDAVVARILAVSAAARPAVAQPAAAPGVRRGGAPTPPRPAPRTGASPAPPAPGPGPSP
jgi:hypothetical protein